MQSPSQSATKINETSETANQAEVSVGDPSEAQNRSDHVQFLFVKSIPDTTARSHAMRMHWRQRKSTRIRRGNIENNRSDNQQCFRPLLPAKNSILQSSVSKDPEAQKTSRDDSKKRAKPTADTASIGLSRQLWDGLQFPFSVMSFWENDSSPFQITVAHREFFYHWLAMHAEEIHSHLGTATYSPFRDIWMPLDLSNPASFSAVMAHAAAHLSAVQKKDNDSDVLRFKIEAIEIVNEWLSDPGTSFKDELFAAVLRLFTFERYYGIPESSYLHKRGLHDMLEARGGYKTFQSNWRLQLALSIVYLTPESSSFGVPANELEDFYCDAFSVSYPPKSTKSTFFRNMNSFDLKSLRDAILLLRENCLEVEPCVGDTFSAGDTSLSNLATIIFICIAVVQRRNQGHTIAGCIDLASLEFLLSASYSSWVNSDKMLVELIWNQFAQRDANIRLKNQIAWLTDSLKGISPLALRGLELCLLERLLFFSF